MRHLLVGVIGAVTLLMVSPVGAQAPSPAITGQSQRLAPAVYADPYGYRQNALTPTDAYRQGLINRWELERLEGPTPQALQGPSPDGSKGIEPGN